MSQFLFLPVPIARICTVIICAALCVVSDKAFSRTVTVK